MVWLFLRLHNNLKINFLLAQLCIIEIFERLFHWTCLVISPCYTIVTFHTMPLCCTIASTLIQNTPLLLPSSKKFETTFFLINGFYVFPWTVHSFIYFIKFSSVFLVLFIPYIFILYKKVRCVNNSAKPRLNNSTF